jgi:hypothetical protein
MAPPPLRLAALLLVVAVALLASTAGADLVISRADRKVSGLPPRSSLSRSQCPLRLTPRI